jgi:molecular chaperone GrpE
MADMDNLRKRSQREKEDLAKFGNETLLREMLPVIDNLERAVAHAVEDKTTDGLLEGVRLTLDQFSKVLEKFQVVPIEALGQVFDPAHHQAMGQLETEDYPANTVVQELQKGYLLNERLLRPAMVMIAKAPVARAEAADTQDTEDTE